MLRSWKAVAGFFGADERTVRRWEARGLPIRRVPGGGKATIYADPTELRDWLNSQGRKFVANADSAPFVELGVPLAAAPLAALRRKPVPLSLIALVAAVALASGGVWFARLPNVNAAPPPAARALAQSASQNWALRTPASLNRARSDFQQALRIAPDYAEAEVGLAKTYLLMREFAEMPDTDAYLAADDHITRALRLAPQLAEAHAVAGFTAFWGHRDTARADSEFGRAIALDPGSALTHQWYGNMLSARGHDAAAVAELDLAERLDPRSDAIHADRALAIAHSQPGAALALLRTLEVQAPDFVGTHRYLADLCLRLADDACFVREMAQLGGRVAIFAPAQSGPGPVPGPAGHVQLLEHMRAEAEAGAGSGRLPAFSAAIACARLGDRAATLRWLDVAVTNRELALAGLQGSWEFDWLRQDPNFRRIAAEAYIS